MIQEIKGYRIKDKNNIPTIAKNMGISEHLLQLGENWTKGYHIPKVSLQRISDTSIFQLLEPVYEEPGKLARELQAKGIIEITKEIA